AAASASQSAAAAAKASASAAAAAKAAAQKAAVAALPAKLDATLGGGGDTWSVATLNLTTHAAMTIGSPSGMYTGSTIKVTILETLLRTGGGVGGLSDYEKQQATAMITQSDNEAALVLWRAGGGDAALQQTVSMLGMTHTQITGGGYFGVSTTSAADQIKVLSELVDPTFLTAADVAYVNNLMANVVPDQRWGTPTMADPGTTTENKNGWLNNDDDSGKWLVNSLGIVVIGGQRYLVAAYSQHHPDFDTGVQRLNSGLAAVAAALRG
ncbi:serine hydrolase, partial [Jatrophihabitans sp. YIM 134969]